MGQRDSTILLIEFLQRAVFPSQLTFTNFVNKPYFIICSVLVLWREPHNYQGIQLTLLYM